MNTYHEPARDIPVTGEYDVVVVGGGVAGWSAAVCAARNGARTLIVEQFPFFGGTATASLMANIVGYRNQVKPDDLQVTKGIGQELTLRLIQAGAAVKSRNTYESEPRSDTPGDLSYNYAFDTEAFKFHTLKMAVDAGVHILFHTLFCDVIKYGDRVSGICIENKSGRQAVYGKVIVDASGDGDAAFRAGAPSWQTVHDEAPRLDDCLMYKIAGFPKDTRAPGCLVGDTMVVWGPSVGEPDGASGAERSDAEVRARLAVYEDLEAKKRAHPQDLAGARIIDTGTLIGVRQTRFIEGDYKLTGEDVLAGRTFPDGIAVGANPVIRFYGYRRFLTHTGYDIPYRCLLPKSVEGMLVAGRCMSSDQIAFESWRAMAHIFAIGEAAGTAAALSARAGVTPRALDVKSLRAQLMAQGAEIGQGRGA